MIFVILFNLSFYHEYFRQNDFLFRQIANSVIAEQNSITAEIDLTLAFDDRLKVSCFENMDAILNDQLLKAEAFAEVNDLMNPNELFNVIWLDMEKHDDDVDLVLPPTRPAEQDDSFLLDDMSMDEIIRLLAQ